MGGHGASRVRCQRERLHVPPSRTLLKQLGWLLLLPPASFSFEVHLFPEEYECLWVTFLISQRFLVLVLFFCGHTVQLAGLVLRPGMEPGPLGVKGWGPNHWTAREFPTKLIFLNYF